MLPRRLGIFDLSRCDGASTARGLSILGFYALVPSRACNSTTPELFLGPLACEQSARWALRCRSRCVLGSSPPQSLYSVVKKCLDGCSCCDHATNCCVAAANDYCDGKCVRNNVSDLPVLRVRPEQNLVPPLAAFSPKCSRRWLRQSQKEAQAGQQRPEVGRRKETQVEGQHSTQPTSPFSRL